MSIYLDRIFDFLGRVCFFITMAEYVPVFVVCIIIENMIAYLFFNKDLKEFQAKVHLVLLNVFFEWSCKLLGLRIIVDKRIDNDFKDKPFLLISTHGSMLDVCTLLG